MVMKVLLWVFAICIVSRMTAQPPMIVVGALSEQERKRAFELLQISQGEQKLTLAELQQRAEKLGFTVKVQDSSWFVLPRSIGPDSIYSYAASLLQGLKELPPQPGRFQFEKLPPAARDACRELLLRTGDLAFNHLTPQAQEALSTAFGEAVAKKPLALTLMEEGQLMISVNIALRPRISIGERLLRTAPIVLFASPSSSLPTEIQARVNQMLASGEAAVPPAPNTQEDKSLSSLRSLPLPPSWRQSVDELRERRGVAFTQLTLYFSKSVTPRQAALLAQKYSQHIDHIAQQVQESYKKALSELIEYWKSHNSFLKEIIPQSERVPFSSLSPYLQRQLMESLYGYADPASLQSQLLNNGWVVLSVEDIDIVFSYPSRVIAIPGEESCPIYEWKGYLLSDLMR